MQVDSVPSQNMRNSCQKPSLWLIVIKHHLIQRRIESAQSRAASLRAHRAAAPTGDNESSLLDIRHTRRCIVTFVSYMLSPALLINQQTLLVHQSTQSSSILLFLLYSLTLSQHVLTVFNLNNDMCKQEN